MGAIKMSQEPAEDMKVFFKQLFATQPSDKEVPNTSDSKLSRQLAWEQIGLSGQDQANI